MSGIIPVFNSEEFLNKCLDSLLNQSFTDIEIICVDDGSTDNSLKILKSYLHFYKDLNLQKRQLNLVLIIHSIHQ